MNKVYKKGQIVPRTLVRCKNRKTQHKIKFGADVEIVGRTVKLLSEGKGIIINGSFIGGKNGKPRKYMKPLMENIVIVLDGFESMAVEMISSSFCTLRKIHVIS